ncbi:MAG: hypothetical protein ABI460_07370 [Caldimonas sp.]
MSAKLPTSQALRDPPLEDGDAAPVPREKRGSLRWVRDVLGRSIRLEQRRNPLQAASVDPKRAPAAVQPPTLLMQQRAELGARLLVHDPATQTVRNLFAVYDELDSGGWAGIRELPLTVMSRGLAEAEMLATDEPSSVLTTIIEGLRELAVAAERRAEHRAHEAREREWEKPARAPEISETDYDEYELMERSWVGTVPAGLDLSDRGT